MQIILYITSITADKTAKPSIASTAIKLSNATNSVVRLIAEDKIPTTINSQSTVQTIVDIVPAYRYAGTATITVKGNNDRAEFETAQVIFTNFPGVPEIALGRGQIAKRGESWERFQNRFNDPT